MSCCGYFQWINLFLFPALYCDYCTLHFSHNLVPRLMSLKSCIFHLEPIWLLSHLKVILQIWHNFFAVFLFIGLEPALYAFVLNAILTEQTRKKRNQQKNLSKIWIKTAQYIWEKWKLEIRMVLCGPIWNHYNLTNFSKHWKREINTVKTRNGW